MATSLSAMLHIEAKATLTATTPHTGDVREDLENASGGTRWTQGTASGQVGKVYRKNGSLSAGATDSFNLLAAGALEDVYGQTIDADELKGLVIKVTSGAVTLNAPAADFLPIFADASDLIKLQNGTTMAFDWGAGGLSLGTSAKFDLTETTGAATATYELWLVVAE